MMSSFYYFHIIIFDNISPAFASIFMSMTLSARVCPILMTQISFPSVFAWFINLKAEKT